MKLTRPVPKVRPPLLLPGAGSGHVRKLCVSLSALSRRTVLRQETQQEQASKTVVAGAVSQGV